MFLTSVRVCSAISPGVSGRGLHLDDKPRVAMAPRLSWPKRSKVKTTGFREGAREMKEEGTRIEEGTRE